MVWNSWVTQNWPDHSENMKEHWRVKLRRKFSRPRRPSLGSQPWQGQPFTGTMIALPKLDFDPWFKCVRCQTWTNDKIFPRELLNFVSQNASKMISSWDCDPFQNRLNLNRAFDFPTLQVTLHLELHHCFHKVQYKMQNN